MKFFLSLCIICFSVFSFAGAQEEIYPFAHCEEATSQTVFLNCQIAVLDDYILNFSKTKLKAANKLVKKECNSKKQSRLAPRLRLLSNLDCEVSIKFEYYNKLADNQ